MQVKTVTSSDLRTNIKRVLNEVEYGTEQYIIEKFGEPTAAIISMEDFHFFQAMQAILEEAKRTQPVEEKRQVITYEDHSQRQPRILKDQEAQYTTVNENENLVESKDRLPKEPQTESLLQMLKTSDSIPETTKMHLQGNLVNKLQVIIQYLESEVLHPEETVNRENRQTPNQKAMAGPYAEHWEKFVGAFSGEEWERPEQGTLEVRETW